MSAPQERSSRWKDVGYFLVGLVVIGSLIAGAIRLWRGNAGEPPARPADASGLTAQAQGEGEPCDGALRDRFSQSGASGPGLAIVQSGVRAIGSVPVGSKSADAAGAPDELPAHEVTFARSFAVAACEISAADYAVFASDSGRSWPSGSLALANARAGASLPAADVSWHDAVAYVGWLSAKTGKSYRLLSEAEWEWAAYGGSESRWPWSNSSTYSCAYANIRGDVSVNRASEPIGNYRLCGKSAYRPAPRGELTGNDFRLYDMLGNVAEWTADCYRSSYEGAPADGSAVESRNCEERVFRGGSWLSLPENARPAFRAHAAPDYRDGVVGFRVARDLTEEELAAIRARATAESAARAAQAAAAQAAGEAIKRAEPTSKK